MKAHRAGSTVGVFLVTGSEAWIDITKAPTSKEVTSSFKKSKKSSKGSDAGPSSTTTSTHWMAESGILDLFVFLGPSSNDIFQQYTALTGRTPLPQLFATAYHQCRWNYLNQADVQDVQTRFDEADIPMDVMWLDIEYAEEHKYFIWDRRNFPEPEKMQDDLAARGRKVRRTPSRLPHARTLTRFPVSSSLSLTLISSATRASTSTPKRKSSISSRRRPTARSLKAGAGQGRARGPTGSTPLAGSGGLTSSSSPSSRRASRF